MRTDEAGAVSAAKKSTALAACTAAILAMVAFAGAAGAKSERDRTPPSAPTDLRVKWATTSAVFLEWTSSQDDVAVAGYHIYRDGGRTSVSSPSYLVGSLACGQSGPIWIQAYDTSGNKSAKVETIVSAAACPDSTPPTTPSGFRQDVTTQDAVVLSWTPSTDDTGVVGYGIYENIARIESTADATVTFSGLRCGMSYEYGVDAVDGAGNRSPIASAYVQTAACSDNDAPSVPTEVTVTSSTETSVSLAWAASTDDVAVVGYEVLVDSTVATQVATTSATVSGLACGVSYSLGVRALDAAGNRSASTTLTVPTQSCSSPPSPGDTTAPTITGRTPAAGATGVAVGVSPTATFSEAMDASTITISTFTLVEQGQTTPVSATVSYASQTATLDPGDDLKAGTSYTATVKGGSSGVKDLAGNPLASDVSWSLTTETSGDGTTTTSASDLTWTQVTNGWGPAERDMSNGEKNAGDGRTITLNGATSQKGLGVHASSDIRYAVSNCTRFKSDVGVDDEVGSRGSVVFQVFAGTTKVYDSGTMTGTSATRTVDVDISGASELRLVVTDAGNGIDSDHASWAGARVECGPGGGSDADASAPTSPTGLSVTATTANSVALAWTASTDDVGVVGYGMYRSDQRVSTTTETSFTFSGLACGTSYNLGVDAYDQAGNRSGKATVAASTGSCTDTQAPTAPSDIVTTSRTATSIALSWAASTDNVGVAGYGLYRGGTLVGTTGQTSAVFSNLTCNTSYTLSLDAYDAAGNRSSKTNVLVSTTACPDTTAPSTPTALAVSNVSQTSLTLSWNPSTDNVGVTGYDVYQGTSKVATTQGTTHTFGNLSCGTGYTLGVVAYDAAGNRSSQATASGSTSACSPSSTTFPSSFYNGPAGSQNILPARQGVLVGTAQSGSYSSVEQQIADLESYIGRKLDIEHRFMQGSSGCPTFDASLVAAIVARGHIPMISWGPSPSNGGQILRGDADACLRQFGQQIAAQPHKVLLRIYWEFNGNWYNWSKDTDGSLLTHDEHRAMWRRSVDQLRAGGAFPKASMIWCPAEGYYKNGDALDEAKAYPGDDYVDWVCSDGYNGGGWCGFHNGWCEFAEIFTHGRCLGAEGLYGSSCNPSRVPMGVEVDFRGRKPYLVGETGSKEGASGQKGEWFRKARDYTKNHMPGMLGFVYFDVAYSDGDWRIGTSDSSKQGFRDLARDSYFNTR